MAGVLRKCRRLLNTMTKKRILATRSDYPSKGISLLKDRYEVIEWDHVKNGDIKTTDLIKNVKDVDAIFCCLSDRIDKSVIDAANSLKIVSTMSVGVDHLDREAMKSKNIRLGYTPDVLTEASAEFTMALLLATSRRLFESNAALRNGEWTSWAPEWMCGPGLKGSTVGIVGFGRIGQSVAKKLKGFEVAKILYGSAKEKPEGIEIGAINTTLENLLKQSDFIIVTCALSDSTRGLFTKEKFSMMKPSTIFINTSRGAVVDQNALLEALKNKTIRAAGLDVMDPEPIPCDHPLLNLDNCVLTPHIASATIQTRSIMAELVSQNIIAALEGTKMPSEYNL